MTQAPDMQDMHSLEVFRHYDRNHWRLSGLPLRSVDTALVKPEYVTLVKSAVMGESNVIAAVHGFLNEFADDYDFSAFAVIWGYQEVQHHYAFTSWLQAVGETVDNRAVAAMRAPYDPGSTPSATLATNIISELTVNHVYRAVSAWVDEPVLKELLLRASRDEAGHAREFRHFAAKRLEAHPEEVPSVLETLYFYTSDDKIRHPVGVFKAGLDELAESETIDTGFELFLDTVAGAGELDELQGKIRRTFGSLTGYDTSSNRAVRRALATALG
ncbi:ferritin-like domain-containing protein [Amycolatopsis tucumanensis]|uniref:Ferritin n=1 Tax=Amycolatopsis tucumanensis TaxID=401106 RepID=A0ABP7HJJ9_9PSEU|nr:ferritin-like domain-containing protein [Amycolatopsis tucumanensis]MCF6421392.1 ferritin-like domain-containing protein [Amycolatopsis tucumanensis]